LAQITQLDPIHVSFTLPEKELPALLAARKLGKIKVQASLPNSSQWLDGHLSFIDNAIDPQAGNIKIKAEFDNRQQQLWPGQYVQAQLTVATMKNAIVVPIAAIVTNAYGKSVYIVDGQQSAKQIPVSLNYSFGTQAVVSGLQGGEKVIVDGKQNLRPGGKVKEMPAAAAKPSKPGNPGKSGHPSAPAQQGGKPA
jgi:RND family efflux transporter MFP subunit